MKPVDELCVLFTDDDEALLDTIHRCLHIRYPRWKPLFAESGPDAFQTLHDNPGNIDVVVCDIQMPMLSGIEVLRIISEELPEVVRIALSGRLDGASIRGSSKYAECHVCKPVPIDILCDKIITTYVSRWTKQT